MVRIPPSRMGKTEEMDGKYFVLMMGGGGGGRQIGWFKLAEEDVKT